MTFILHLMEKGVAFKFSWMEEVICIQNIKKKKSN